MYYGHAPRRGRRRPAYEWVPSFFPSRRRRKRQPLPTGFGPTSRRSRANPRGLRPRELQPPPPYNPIPDSWHYPKLSLVPSSIGEGLAEMFAGAALTVVWLFWQYFLAAGLAVLVLRYLTRCLRNKEKYYTIKCEQSYCAYRINRKNSVNPPPTAAALEAAWAATRGGRRGDPAVLAARLRLGSMLSDLEPTVDQSYIRDETGAIVGRQPGLRGWIGFYTPSLVPHYKSLMAYKALADKLRLALHIEEPDTLDNVIELEYEQQIEGSKNSRNARDSKTTTIISNSMHMKMRFSVIKSNVEEIKKAHRELFGSGMPGTMAALEAALRERLGLAWMRRGRHRTVSAA